MKFTRTKDHRRITESQFKQELEQSKHTVGFLIGSYPDDINRPSIPVIGRNAAYPIARKLWEDLRDGYDDYAIVAIWRYEGDWLPEIEALIVEGEVFTN